MILQRGLMALVVHHLRPFKTYSSPSRLISSSILVASEDATCGSVMAYALRISPARRGLSHCSCCANVPYLASTSILPRSGALQLNTACAQTTLLMVSNNGAISTLVKPGLHGSYSCGRNRFHKPSALANSRNSSNQGGVCHRLSWFSVQVLQSCSRG